MKRRKTPPERKAQEYENEYRYEAWHSVHGDRRNRPLKKALEHRAHRRNVQQVLPSTPTSLNEDSAEALTTEAKPLRQKAIRFRSTAVPLAEHIRGNKARRLRSVGRKYFGRPYSREIHRERFACFLEDVVRGGTADTVFLAEAFKNLLASPTKDAALARLIKARVQQASGGRDLAEELDFLFRGFPSLWLASFLRDEPHWRGRLESWIEETLSNRT